MKKIYNSPVIRLTQIRQFTLMAGSAKGGYDPNSVTKEADEELSRRKAWSFNDDEY
jgi:hypothetical protein